MLRDEIKLKLNECLKNKDKKSVSTLRLVLAAVKDKKYIKILKRAFEFCYQMSKLK